MSNNINTSYNAQFAEFVKYAESPDKGGNIARAGLSSNGKPREIDGTTESLFYKLIFRAPARKATNDYTRAIFLNAVADMFGGENNIPASVKTAMRLDKDFGKGRPLTARRIGIVKSAIDLEMARSLADKKVTGEGECVDAIKDIIVAKVGGSKDPEKKLNEALARNSGAMMNWTICGEMKKYDAGGANAQFEKDVYRGLDLTLKSGGSEIKLSGNFETARDQLARFVAGDENAKYGTLSAQDRKQVHILMSLVSQETEKAGGDAIQHALHPDESDMAFTLGNVKSDPGIRKFNIEKTQDGGISLVYEMDKPVEAMQVFDGDDDVRELSLDKQRSRFTCKLGYTIPGDEMKRLGNVDFSGFEESKAYKTFNGKIDLGDGSRGYAPNKLDAIRNDFDEQFKINAGCKVEFTMKLYPGEEN